MSGITLFQLLLLLGVAAIWFAIADGVRRLEKASQEISVKLDGLDALIGCIPGVENYESPDIHEYMDQRQINPDAHSYDRRNWQRR